MTLERLIALAEPSGAERKIFRIRRINAEDDVQGHDGIPPFTTLSLVSFVIFVRLVSPSVPKPGH